MVHDTTEHSSETLRSYSHWLFTQPCTFVLGVQTLQDLPPLSYPEVAFIGRSNVGKSSLINALIQRKSLARISHTPGRTQQLNYFLLAERLYLVDMPGYGYAQVSRRMVKAWTEVIRAYLRGRSTLKRVYLLIDARHGLKPSDLEFMKLMDQCATSYQIILTKIDQVTSSHLAYLQETTISQLTSHAAAYPILHSTSSHKKNGIEDLRLFIAEWVHLP